MVDAGYYFVVVGDIEEGNREFINPGFALARVSRCLVTSATSSCLTRKVS